MRAIDRLQSANKKTRTSFLKKVTLRVRNINPKVLPLIIILVAGFSFAFIQKNNLPSSNSIAFLPEANELAGKNYSFQELTQYFTELSNKKGAGYAYEVLKVAPVPPGTDMHLLGHVVGDLLYKQKGADGIRICTEDFRNACSHAIVVGLFAVKGETALQEISQACRQAPGGSGAYSMCFHGLGHGVLSSQGYEMEKAADICKKTGQSPTQLDVEAVQCISGMVMEIISGGGHDRQVWEVQNKKYLNVSEPLSLCQASYIPKEAQPLCYDYLTPFLFIAAGGNLAQPTPADFEKAFTFCNQIPTDQARNRDSCFGGFGKEFVVLAPARDIRRIDQMSQNELSQVYNWCKLAPAKEASAACLTHALSSLYWGGENDYQASINFCTLMADDYFQGSCFLSLINQAFYYRPDKQYLKNLCSQIPDKFRPECNRRV